MSFEYIYGYYPVINSLSKTSLIKIKKIFLVQNKYNYLKIKLKEKNIFYEVISLQQMNNLLKNNKHQNIAANIEKYNYFSFNKIISNNNFELLRILILDRIFDPHNFGAIIRVAAANNFHFIIILNNNQSQINSIVAKTAAGALSLIPICQVNNLNNIINILKQKYKFLILGAAKIKKSINYFKINYKTNLALIIGNEQNGINLKLLKNTDYIIQIPINPKIESLNASVACGIIANYIYIQTLKLNYSI